MKSLKLKNKDFDKLREAYPPFYFLHWEVFWTEKLKSHVVTACMSNATELKKDWERINSALPFFLEEELESDFEKWNLYLLFFVYEPVSKHLKYKIENDQYACRKIVVENFHNYDSPELESKIEEIILQRIFNLDLQKISVQENTGKSKNAPFNPEIETIIEKYDLDPRSDKNVDKGQRKEAYKELLALYKYEI